MSRKALPVGQDSLPLHVLAGEDPATEQAMLPVLAGLPGLLDQYAQWLANLHPNLVERLLAMAKTKDKGPQFHLDALIKLVGARRVIEEVGLKRFIEEVGPERVIEELKEIREKLTPEQKRALKELGS